MGKTICLDAGHYGKYNRSPAVKDYYESDMNWKLHLLLKKELESYGFKVTQTRSTQAKDLDLYERGAASKGCDLFLSIHSNAVGDNVNESVDYPLVIVQLDGKGNALGKKIASCIKSTMATKQAAQVITKKGNNGEYYGVLRGAAAVGTMGMILEHSFHTNTKMANWLLQDSNLAKLAAAEAAIIADHFGMKKADQKQETTKTTVYRVRTGAYIKKANADAHLNKVKKAGFDGWMEKVNDKYTIFAGSFEVKKNAENRLAEVKKAGFKGTIVTKTTATTSTKTTTAAPAKKSVDEIAREVINGDWGNGTERKQRLTAAGYDYATIQKRVNELVKG